MIRPLQFSAPKTNAIRDREAQAAIDSVARSVAGLYDLFRGLIETDPQRGISRVRGAVAPRAVEADPTARATFGRPDELVVFGDFLYRKLGRERADREWRKEGAEGDHSVLSNLDYASSAHTGFASDVALNAHAGDRQKHNSLLLFTSPAAGANRFAYLGGNITGAGFGFPPPWSGQISRLSYRIGSQVVSVAGDVDIDLYANGLKVQTLVTVNLDGAAKQGAVDISPAIQFQQTDHLYLYLKNAGFSGTWGPSWYVLPLEF